MDYIVIMAGGSGTRLWPMSRNDRPKQFQKIISDQTLLQSMYDNAKYILPIEQIYLMAAGKFESLIREQLPELPSKNLLYEPSAKDNGPAFILAAAEIIAKDKDANIVVLWSDQLVKNRPNFVKALNCALKAVRDYPDHIIIVGVKPTEPDPGLGYIKIGKEVKEYAEGPVHTVLEFKEKPDIETARKYVASWNYLWNAGYKIFSAKTLLDEFKKAYPDLADDVDKIIAHIGTKDEQKVISLVWEKFPKLSIEYLLTDKLKKMLVVPADLEWSDIGNWQKLHDVLSTQNGHNMVVKGHHVGVDNEGCLIYAYDKMIATVGLKDTIVVETPDVIFIADKHHAHDVKKVVEKLKEEGKHAYL